MSESRPYLPGPLGEIADVAGETAALKLAAARGGTVFYIPMEAAGSQLADIVGEAAARKIIQTIGAGRIRLPAGSARCEGWRRAEVRRLIEDGASPRKAALKAGVSQRTAERIAASMKVDDGQAELPFDKD